MSYLPECLQEHREARPVRRRNPRIGGEVMGGAGVGEPQVCVAAAEWRLDPLHLSRIGGRLAEVTSVQAATKERYPRAAQVAEGRTTTEQGKSKGLAWALDVGAVAV